MTDSQLIISWWAMILGIGLIFQPLAALIFSTFEDRGYIFSKIISILFTSYLVFLFGTFRLLPFGIFTILFSLSIGILINIFVTRRFIHLKNTFKKWKLFIVEELLFLACIIFWSLIRGAQPDINGLEKFMDFGFVNSVLRTQYFPATDMWFASESINYYYFGHFTTALLTKLSTIPSYVTYNLMIATLFAFSFVCSFSIGLNLLNVVKKYSSRLMGGLLTAFLVSMSGNLHTIYSFFAPYPLEEPKALWRLAFSPSTFPNQYWYPNATRFIPFTIHEFPLYSFVVSDLHGHVLSIPIVLTIIALLIQLYKTQVFSMIHMVLLSLLLATAYMTNAWDLPIYFLLSVFILTIIIVKNFLKTKGRKTAAMHVFKTRKKHLFEILSLVVVFSALHMVAGFNLPVYVYLSAFLVFCFVLVRFFSSERKKERNILSILANIPIYVYGNFLTKLLIPPLVIVGLTGIFTLPFNYFFKPFSSGIGILCAPQFLINKGSIGPFLFEADHCQHSDWWMLLTLYGFFIIFALIFIAAIFKKRIAFNQSSQIIFFLMMFGFFLIIIPEFVYAKDIYPAHYRANTMFKLVYQAFILLSIVSSFVVVSISKGKRSIFLYFLTTPLIALVMIYPYYATTSYYGDLTYKGLNGISYLQSRLPSDYESILWLQENISDQPVILEAQGDSYTDYARISANTGLPTVLGWYVHEWLWRGDSTIPAPRSEDVRTLYETADLTITRSLVKKYNIEYVYVGSLEEEKYTSLNEEKFQKIGKIVYQNAGARIYRLN